MKIHDLKCWPEFFELIFTGKKNFELRQNDRRFAAGDILLLREYDDRSGNYTGRECRRIITYVMDGVGPGAITPMQGLARGYVILALVAD